MVPVPGGSLTGAVRRGVAGHDPPPSRRLLELLAVSGAAVAQPVLDVFSKSADVFVLRGAGPLDVVAFAAVVAFGPPLGAWLVELLVGIRSRRVSRVVHLGFLSTFAVVIVIQVLKEVTDQGYRRIFVASLVAGPALVATVVSVAALRTWLRILAVFPVVLVGLFLLTSAVSDVVFEDDVGAADAAVANPAPVVVIVLDELPTGSLLDAEGRVDASLFPNFAALADGSTWYRNHTTVAPITVDAVPAILTGQWPRLGGTVPTSTAFPENLFTLLARRYDLHVQETATQLCPPDVCPDRHGGALGPLLGDAVDVWTRRASPKPTRSAALDFDVAAHRDDVERQSDVEEFTRGLGASSSRPRLDFFHAMLPHGPWTFLPSGARYVGPHPPDGNVFYAWATEFAANAGRSRHLLQLQYTDRVLGEVLDRLRDLGTYDESLVVVTADHGVDFGVGDNLREANPDTYPEIMWTPLFVKAPRQAQGEIVETPSRSIDVLPTIADHLGIDLPWEVDGRSLRRPGRQRRDVRILDSSFARGDERDGQYLLFDGEEGYREVLASGGGVPEDPLGLYRLEPFGGLVGLDVDDLEVEPGRGLRARLDQPQALADVDLDAAELPVYVSGEVTAEDPVDVAVVLNGVVAGWCETTDMAGVRNGRGSEDYPFSVVVPEALLRRGDNEVELYELRGPQRLRRVQLR